MQQDSSEEMVGRWKAAFHAAADHFDDEPLSFFARFGAELVARCDVASGERVLDAGANAVSTTSTSSKVISARSASRMARSTPCSAASRSSSSPTCPAPSPSCGGWLLRVGVTSWGPDLFQPASVIWWDALKVELTADQIPTGPSPRAQWESPEQARGLFASGGIDGPIASEYVAGIREVVTDVIYTVATKPT
jgi:hypothetical protein